MSITLGINLVLAIDLKFYNWRIMSFYRKFDEVSNVLVEACVKTPVFCMTHIS